MALPAGYQPTPYDVLCGNQREFFFHGMYVRDGSSQGWVTGMNPTSTFSQRSPSYLLACMLYIYTNDNFFSPPDTILTYQAGNEHFRKVVSSYARRYIAAKTRTEKGDISAEVVDSILVRARTNGGTGFITCQPNTDTDEANDKQWRKLSFAEAKDKCGHAIRKCAKLYEIQYPKEVEKLKSEPSISSDRLSSEIWNDSTKGDGNDRKKPGSKSSQSELSCSASSLSASAFISASTSASASTSTSASKSCEPSGPKQKHKRTSDGISSKYDDSKLCKKREPVDDSTPSNKPKIGMDTCDGGSSLSTNRSSGMLSASQGVISTHHHHRPADVASQMSSDSLTRDAPESARSTTVSDVGDANTGVTSRFGQISRPDELDLPGHSSLGLSSLRMHQDAVVSGILSNNSTSLRAGLPGVFASSLMQSPPSGSGGDGDGGGGGGGGDPTSRSENVPSIETTAQHQNGILLDDIIRARTSVDLPPQMRIAVQDEIVDRRLNEIQRVRQHLEVLESQLLVILQQGLDSPSSVNDANSVSSFLAAQSEVSATNSLRTRLQLPAQLSAVDSNVGHLGASTLAFPSRLSQVPTVLPRVASQANSYPSLLGSPNHQRLLESSTSGIVRVLTSMYSRQTTATATATATTTAESSASQQRSSTDNARQE